MIQNRTLLAGVLAAAAFLPLLAQTPKSAAKAAAKQDDSSSAAYSSEGERVFKQNCSRCHNAPQGFSPQISATVARHMRVRANLSARDEKALLKFLNP